MMITIPTIELRAGSCVWRPPSPATEHSPHARSPVGLARAWAAAGFRRLHISDLDSDTGFDGNAQLIDDIVREGASSVQVVAAQSTDAVDRIFDVGADRVILDSRVLEDPRWLESTADAYPGSLVIATHVRERRVMTRGWMRNVAVDIFDVIEELEGLPLAGFLVSVVDGDEGSSPSDLALLEDIAEACSFPVFTVGGVATIDDLRALEHRGVSGAVLGPVLYSGALDTRAIAQEFGG
jgi:phosphoribosylformimino-5-aminoimidazole carboxamide ribotide isomerase